MSIETPTLTPPQSDRSARPGPVEHRRGGAGSPEDPSWARPALLGLLAATALLYLWGLGASGWANSFYSAAAQAGADSWKAFFFGSSDAASSITVDKPPMALWLMALSVRVFGLSSWSILVPQALLGVASVGLLHATVRRTTGSAAAGLIAGAVLALTPVAVLMFRFNNPDALLVLLLIGSVASTVRALESSRLRADGLKGHPVRWLALGGALVGFAFLTKMLQAVLVLPALALVYLLCAHTPIGKRIAHLLVAFGSMILAAGWWIAIVELWPASTRPYIGGSQGNSILELTLGYNGLGRITGNEVGSVGGGAGGTGTGMWGETGLLRMFDSEIGGQIAWLLPAALILLGAGLWFTRRAPRTDLQRAGLVVWGGWLLVTALTFSFMAGIFHAYYTVALAPGDRRPRRQRRDPALEPPRVVRRGAGDGLHARVHHGVQLRPARPDHRLPPLAQVGRRRRRPRSRRSCWSACGSSPAGSPWSRPVPPSSQGSPAPRRTPSPRPAPRTPAPSRAPARAAADGGMGGRRRPGGRLGAPAALLPPDRHPGPAGRHGDRRGRAPAASSAAASPRPPITALLQTDADSYTWAAAAIGSNSAAGYQLASEEPVMAIGGFNGSDPSPTLAQFQTYVANGEIHYFIAGGGRLRRTRRRHRQQPRSRPGWRRTSRDDRRRRDDLRPLRGRPVSAPATEPRPDGLPLADLDAPALDMVIPVHNEEAGLAGSVARVHEHLSGCRTRSG